MRLLFWVSLLTIGYTYFGYLAWLTILAKIHRPTHRVPMENFTPTVSVVMSVRNESSKLKAKLENFRELNYPAGLLEFVIVSDGSTDETAAFLRAESGWLQPIVLTAPEGKAAALSRAVTQAHGEILVLCDVRQRLDRDAISALTRRFSDPHVGAVSGELLLEDVNGDVSGEGLGLYWRIEKAVRRLESLTGSVVGVTGALYAVRRHLFQPIPAGTVLDDVYVPMQVARSGYRVLFEPAAKARDRIFLEPGKEFRRKVRTLSGNYQLIQRLPWLLTPANPLLIRFISHKMLRLAVPLFLLLLFFASATSGGTMYLSLLVAQLIFYGLAAWGTLSPSRRELKVVGLAYTFVLLNTAAVVAFKNFVTGKPGTWD